MTQTQIALVAASRRAAIARAYPRRVPAPQKVRLNRMSAHSHLLQTYLRLRKIGMKLGERLVETLSQEVIDEGGRKLGLLQKGTLVLGS
jgi:hypothetical protein